MIQTRWCGGRTTEVTALGDAIRAKDEYTRGHSDRVAMYAGLIAREMGLREAEIEEIVLAGMLHDVGKVAVPDEILTRPGRLTAHEYAQLMEHTALGEMILAPLFNDRPVVLQVARLHHEWYDGSRSRDGLVGDALPLAARIVAVADAYDAMTSARPYRAPLPLSAAIAELKKGAGTQFDPACVAAFLTVLARAMFHWTTEGRTERRKDGRTEGWKDGRTDGRTEREASRGTGGPCPPRGGAVGNSTNCRGRWEGSRPGGYRPPRRCRRAAACAFSRLAALGFT
jgi:HD-GYP domain-containing protein (c-di-GMP phosphodiesterase class II)